MVGAPDFAGGLLLHLDAGIAGLVRALVPVKGQGVDKRFKHV